VLVDTEDVAEGEAVPVDVPDAEAVAEGVTCPSEHGIFAAMSSPTAQASGHIAISWWQAWKRLWRPA